MNNHEATRYVHKLIADVLRNEFAHVNASDYPWAAGKDAGKLQRVIDHWIELHARRGPLATDRAPRDKENVGEPLPFDEPAPALDPQLTAITQHYVDDAVRSQADALHEMIEREHGQNISGDGDALTDEHPALVRDVGVRPRDHGDHETSTAAPGDGVSDLRDVNRIAFADDVTSADATGYSGDDLDEILPSSNPCTARRLDHGGVAGWFRCTKDKNHIDNHVWVKE